MGHDLRRRLSRAERLLPAAIEGQLKRREQSKQRLSSLARVHATAVAGIVLVGGPKIDEPWTSALARAVAQYQRTDRVLEHIETLTEYFQANMGVTLGNGVRPNVRIKLMTLM